jgi:hypothetical protein
MTEVQRTMRLIRNDDNEQHSSQGDIGHARYVPLPGIDNNNILNHNNQSRELRVTNAIQQAKVTLQQPTSPIPYWKQTEGMQQQQQEEEEEEDHEGDYDELADPELVRIRRSVQQLEKTGSYPSDDVAHTYQKYVSQWTNHPTVKIKHLHPEIRVPSGEEERQLTNAPGFIQRSIRKSHEDEWLRLSFDHSGEKKNQI